MRQHRLLILKVRKFIFGFGFLFILSTEALGARFLGLSNKPLKRIQKKPKKKPRNTSGLCLGEEIFLRSVCSVVC